MADKIVRLNTTVSNGRILIYFSFPPAAQSYKEYLEKPENAYNDTHEWGVTISGGEVSMNLPSDLDSKFHGGSKNAVLIFEDEIKAMKWEQKMILWERSEKNEATERSMLRSLKFGHLYEKIHLPEREFDGVGFLTLITRGHNTLLLEFVTHKPISGSNCCEDT
jgi:hypothetical protein